jgi:hypothetical protein
VSKQCLAPQAVQPRHCRQHDTCYANCRAQQEALGAHQRLKAVEQQVTHSSSWTWASLAEELQALLQPPRQH